MVDGKPKPIRRGGFRTKKEAQVAAAEVENELRKGVVPNFTLVPLRDYFDSWVKTYKVDITNNTLVRYKVTLKTIEDYFGDTPIQAINKRDYQEFLNIYGKSHARLSSKKINTHIRACVKEAIEEGLIRIDFTREAVLTGHKGKSPEEKHLHYGESISLLHALTERLNQGMVYYLLLLGLTSGMRFGEIVGLTRRDFDFVHNTININKTWGYNNKMPKGFGPTKNDRSIRKIKMDKKTMKIFNELFKSTPDNALGLVFISQRSKYNVVSNNYSNSVLNKILTELKIEKMNLHGLRHTHASVLLYKGASIIYVSERLGHADTETTMNTYLHVIKELRQRDEELSSQIIENMHV